ncbi:uncharacterized protein Dwil_GK16741 [Drosophila willistoni]|uniref:U3 small nucleolar RNA-associated protein 6 homolog n=1 Tax=Drosophila willistoni TaxID=7260 RepID=B4NPX1_DROWI|nr:uncharacterized protein LOC6652873 [Drosophila willistoni]EDW86196.1 uncharacterized protein Dwil_GK16741 [Drosophila willistoni]
MGEFIAEMQERILPEYEQMNHYNLFTPEQVREIISRRDHLFQKITKGHLTVSDYLEFIVYEKQMHETIVAKEEQMHLKLSGLKTSITVRIMRLYREVLVKFSHDRRLWGHWINFSKRNNPQEVAGIYEKMLQYHGDEPSFWVDAAMWLYEYNRLNIERVQDTLLRGLQRHPTSERLNKCFFDILLTEAALADNEKNLEDNTLSEQDIKLERVAAVYNNSMKNVTHLDYFIKLLESCENHHEITNKLQRNILHDMQEKFPREPLLWDLLAQRELRGYHLGDMEQQDLEQEEPAFKRTRLERPFKGRLELFTTVYKTAVDLLKTQEIWNLYIDALLAIKTNSKSERSLKQQYLANALQEGHRSQLMSIRHYSTLKKMLCSTPAGCSTAVQIFNEALKRDPSVEMYQLLMDTLVLNDEEPQVYEVFHKIQKTMGSESFPLWRSVICYYRTRERSPSNRERLENIYAEACKSKYPEFAELRSDYLRYLWIENSPESARKEYKKLSLQPPLTLQLHREMAQLESTLTIRDSANLKSWRMCLEHMALHFGKTEPSVWVDYLAFERDHGEAKNINLLTQRAVSTLEPQYVHTFEMERTLAHLGAAIVG